MITMMMDGNPIRHVNPMEFSQEVEDLAVIEEMQEMLNEVVMPPPAN